MNARNGPEDDAARTATPSHPGPCVKGARQNPHRQVQGITSPPHIGRYASGWRAGFRAGAIDALRLAQRQINDPEVWWALAQLTDHYDDDYEMCGGDR